jgi:uncharacterized membrane protein
MTSRVRIHKTELIHEITPTFVAKAEAKKGPRWTPFVLAILAVLGLIVFLVTPGTIGAKTHIALHGICAQRPSHTFWLGDAALPLDARMTGIYLAAATTLVWLGAIGRLRAASVPNRVVLATLAFFIVMMGIDGTNGLLADLGLWHVYGPTNLTRLITGILAGVSLGVGIAHIFALSMWANPQTRVAVVEKPSEIVPPIVMAGCVGFIAAAGLPSAFDLLAVGLVVGAIVVFWLPSMVIIALFTGKSWLATRFEELDRMAIVGLIVAVMILAALSILRSIAELTLHLPKLT